MKFAKKSLSFTAFALAALSVCSATEFTSANLFWTGTLNQQSLESLSRWSTNSSTVTAPTSIDWANTVIGKMSSYANTSYGLASMPNSTLTFKGIYWGTVSGAYNIPFEIYNNANNSTLTITDGITLDDASSYIRIRRKQNSGTFAVNVGDVYIKQGSIVNFGYAGSAGQFLTSVNFTGNLSIKGTSSVAANLNIVSNAFAIADNASITLDYGNFSFFKGTAETSAVTAPVWAPVVDLSKTTLNVANTASFIYGASWSNPGTGDVSFGDINFTSSAVNFTQSIYTSSEVRTAGNLKSTVAGAAGSVWYLKTNNSLMTAASADLSLETVRLAAKLRVTGNYKDSYTAGKSYIQLDSSEAAFTVDGTFESANANGTIFGKSLGATNKSYSFGGITGTGGFISTARYVGGQTSDTGKTTFVLTGNGSYSTKAKITDMAWGSDGFTLGSSTGALAITKDGTGTQYFRGVTFYRGATTVNAGRLYIKADSTGRESGAVKWGIGSVVLNGGYFGAVGATTEIGTVYATDITFAGGALAYDISGSSFDVIKLVNTSDVITATDASLISFEFNLDNIELDNDYKIMEWDATIGALGYDVNDFAYTINGYDDLVATFSYAADGDGLYVTFSTIPEPAAFAAFFGFAALLFAMRKKRK